MAWQLSRKDNLYNVLVTEKIKDLDLNDIKHLWLIKPVASSRSRGIRLLTDIESLPKKNKYIATHYVYNPHLINGKKYDLRIYLLVTGIYSIMV